MIARLLACLALGALACACATKPRARTYADVETAVARMQADWERSQLTDHPQKSLITRDLRFRLFFQLPLAERAVVVMDSFASTDLDGELAFFMLQRLIHRDGEGGGTASAIEDRAYTAALFRLIESFSEVQVRRFCYDEARYARFRRNLRRWKAYCQPPA